MVALAVAGGFVVVPASPAVACSCGTRTVAEAVGRTEAVYVARPRVPGDLFPGASFRVQRVLKGPQRSNLRVKVRWLGGGAACATRVRRTEYVVVFHRGEPAPLSSCDEHLVGPDAVRQAEAVLGRGRPVPWRPDPIWLTNWLLVPSLAVAFLVMRRAYRTARRPP